MSFESLLTAECQRMLWIHLAQDAYADLTFGNDVTWKSSFGHDCFRVDAFIEKRNKKAKHTTPENLANIAPEK